MNQLVSERHCARCGKSITRGYWRKDYPNMLFCQECWRIPGASQQTIRNSIAKVVKDARKMDRVLARMILRSFRGTGVPNNPKRSTYDEATAVIVG